MKQTRLPVSPSLDYANLDFANKSHGFEGFVLIVSNIFQFVAALIFIIDVIDFNWYMFAALAMMVTVPFWIAGVIAILMVTLRGPSKARRLIPLSIFAHVLSVACCLLVFARYNL